MRLINDGVISWGPEQIKCPRCDATWEVEKDDLRVFQREVGVQWDMYKTDVLGFICEQCDDEIIIQVSDNLRSEIVRKYRNRKTS